MKITIASLLFTFITLAEVSESHSWIFSEQKLDDSAQNLIGPRKYMASFSHHSEHLCSAFFVSNQHALTAANCLRDFLIHEDIPDFSEYFIMAGLFKLSTEKLIYKIIEVEVHKRYNAFKYSDIYDIGVIKLFNKVIQSPHVDWVALTAEKARPYVQAETLGWKSQTVDDQLIMLRRIEIQFQSTSECNAHRKSSSFCVTPLNSSDTFIKDDIGVPLIQDGYAVGILVRLLTDRLTVFTNLKKYSEDIIEMMEERSMKYANALSTYFD